MDIRFCSRMHKSIIARTYNFCFTYVQLLLCIDKNSLIFDVNLIIFGRKFTVFPPKI